MNFQSLRTTTVRKDASLQSSGQSLDLKATVNALPTAFGHSLAESLNVQPVEGKNTLGGNGTLLYFAGVKAIPSQAKRPVHFAGREPKPTETEPPTNLGMTNLGMKVRNNPADFCIPHAPEDFTLLQNNIWTSLMQTTDKLCKDGARVYENNAPLFLKDLNNFLVKMDTIANDGKSGARVVSRYLDARNDYIVDNLMTRIHDYICTHKTLAYPEIVEMINLGDNLKKLGLDEPQYASHFRKAQTAALEVLRQRAWMEVFDAKSFQATYDNQGYWNLADRFKIESEWGIHLTKLPKIVALQPNKLLDVLWPTHATGSLPIKQKNVGDCYLLAALMGLSEFPSGQAFLKDFIRKNVQPMGEDSFDVTFPGVRHGAKAVTVRVAISDLVDQIATRDIEYSDGNVVKKGELLKHAEANLFVNILERAYGRMRQLTTGNCEDTLMIVSHGNADEVWKAMGVPTKDINTLSWPEQSQSPVARTTLEKILMAKALQPDSVAIGLATSKNPGSPNLVKRHAYALQSVDAATRTATILNPHNSADVLTMSFDEIFKHFCTVSLARIAGNANPVTLNLDAIA